ncbi:MULTISPECIES: hypothetical protein [unclassified Mesorhizobium]|uniref:hypothetical protein n=1 Tax=unclassified Mesorhizobium TaxID=325217 RepID=UPI003336C01B
MELAVTDAEVINEVRSLRGPATKEDKMDAEQERTAEYQGNDIAVLSREPLTGSCELMMNDDGIVELMLDRESAEDLISALVQFLGVGTGKDAPRNRNP